jgi:hypothetical protein
MGFLVFVFCLTLAPARPLADQTLQLAVSAIFGLNPRSANHRCRFRTTMHKSSRWMVRNHEQPDPDADSLPLCPKARLLALVQRQIRKPHGFGQRRLLITEPPISRFRGFYLFGICG